MPEVWELIQGGKPLSLNELNNAADELLRECGTVKVWLFSGELGAGKTTLIKAIGNALGVKEWMSSPTFSIINEYTTKSGESLYHCDFYRLKGEQEAFDIGTEEYLESGNYCFVEWPDRIPSLIPKERVEINILPGPGPEYRIIQYAKHD
jgi:tRNA threonylcarbamoyladenosine biosynthesis protein TsaE